MSTQEPRSDKIVTVCKLRNELGSLYDQFEIEKEDYDLIIHVLQDIEKNPEDWVINQSQNEVSIEAQTHKETLIWNLESGSYLWAQR